MKQRTALAHFLVLFFLLFWPASSMAAPYTSHLVILGTISASTNMGLEDGVAPGIAIEGGKELPHGFWLWGRSDLRESSKLETGDGRTFSGSAELRKSFTPQGSVWIGGGYGFSRLETSEWQKNAGAGFFCLGYFLDQSHGRWMALEYRLPDSSLNHTESLGVRGWFRADRWVFDFSLRRAEYEQGGDTFQGWDTRLGFGIVIR